MAKEKFVQELRELMGRLPQARWAADRAGAKRVGPWLPKPVRGLPALQTCGNFEYAKYMDMDMGMGRTWTWHMVDMEHGHLAQLMLMWNVECYVWDQIF